MATVQDQIKNLSDEELDQLERELKRRQATGGGVATTIGSGLLQGARGALAVSQGRALPEREKETAKAGEDIETFEKKERIKAQIKQEFGGGGGLQMVNLPGGGFAFIPGGQAKGNGEGAGTIDSSGKPQKLEDVTVSPPGSGISGKVPKSPEQLERELEEERLKGKGKLEQEITKGRLVNTNNFQLISGVTRDLSQVYADAFEEGGAGGFLQATKAKVATKIGDLPEELGGEVIGGKFAASGAFPGKRMELILKMMPMLTQQATKPEGSVRIITGVLDALGTTIPELGTAPATADRQLTESLRTFYRFARAAEQIGMSIDDVFVNRDVNTLTEDEITSWAQGVANKSGSIEIKGKEEEAIESIIGKALEPIRGIRGGGDDAEFERFLKATGQ